MYRDSISLGVTACPTDGTRPCILFQLESISQDRDARDLDRSLGHPQRRRKEVVLATTCRHWIHLRCICVSYHTIQAMRAAARNPDGHQLLVELAGKVECGLRLDPGSLRQTWVSLIFKS
jgi:hypothetical protein